jgi:hypothetical protein
MKQILAKLPKINPELCSFVSDTPVSVICTPIVPVSDCLASTGMLFVRTKLNPIVPVQIIPVCKD